MYNCIFFLTMSFLKNYSPPAADERFFGDFSGGVHLFPFRTESLSPPAQMVLHLFVGEYVVAKIY